MSDWKQEREKVLAEARCLVIKMGSAVLTGPDGLDSNVLDDLAYQMTVILTKSQSVRKILLVSSGAVAAGRSVLSRSDITPAKDLASRQGAAAVGQGRLMQAWDEAFHKVGINTAQVLLTQDDFRVRQRLLNARNTFSNLFDWGVVPIVNENDTVSTEGLKFGDNDALASLMVTLVGADLMINLTSAPGVYAKPPKADEKPEIMPVVENVATLDLDAMCGGKTTVGTGGMYSKLLSARRAAQRGVPTLILPGREHDVLLRAFDGEDVGTWVRPGKHAISSRKFWLAYKSAPVGMVEVDDGCAEALLKNGKSLLPGGILDVKGTFKKGDLIRIVYKGKSLGVGVSNYKSADIERIKGLKRIEVAAILGDAQYPEVIHRDNLLLEAAI
ncbi:MAG: glutamate 5-kinase [Desulfovibrionaceae bacterium]|nr:glutamate 5-kinase [Desulfovibrionaceae bacterium]